MKQEKSYNGSKNEFSTPTLNQVEKTSHPTLSKVCAIVCGLIIILFPIILIGLTFFLFFYNPKILLVYLIVFAADLLALILIINLLLSFIAVKMKNRVNKKYNIAIIFAEKNGIFDLVLIYLSGVFFLIWFLRVTKESYKICYVSDKSTLNKIILNKKFNKLFIFGHGTIYGVGINKELFEYSSLKNKLKEKKEFVSQLHCNSNEYERLSDVSMKMFSKKYYITNKKMHIWDIWIYLLLLYLSKSLIYN
jgi:hypothetical protein